MMQAVYFQFKIQHQNFIPYHPKLNVVFKATNKNTKKIVKKMAETYKDWNKQSPFALHAYRKAIQTSMGATLFSLIYRMKNVLPIEVEIPSLKVLMESQVEEAEWVKN